VSRYRLRTITSPYTVRKVYGKLASSEDFLCDGCVKKLRQQTMRVREGKVHLQKWAGVRTPCKPIKRPLQFTPQKDIDAPMKRPSCRPTPKKIPAEDEKESEETDELGEYVCEAEEELCQALNEDSTTSSYQSKTFPSPEEIISPVADTVHDFRATSCRYIKNSRYLEAMRVLLKNSKAAKKGMMTALCEEVRREVVRVTSTKRKVSIESLRGPVTLEALSDFSWKEVRKQTETIMPVFFQMLNTMLPSLTKIAKGTVKGPKSHKR